MGSKGDVESIEKAFCRSPLPRSYAILYSTEGPLFKSQALDSFDKVHLKRQTSEFSRMA